MPLCVGSVQWGTLLTEPCVALNRRAFRSPAPWRHRAVPCHHSNDAFPAKALQQEGTDGLASPQTEWLQQGKASQCNSVALPPQRDRKVKSSLESNSNMQHYQPCSLFNVPSLDFLTGGRGGNGDRRYCVVVYVVAAFGQYQWKNIDRPKDCRFSKYQEIVITNLYLMELLYIDYACIDSWQNSKLKLFL